MSWLSLVGVTFAPLGRSCICFWVSGDRYKDRPCCNLGPDATSASQAFWRCAVLHESRSSSPSSGASFDVGCDRATNRGHADDIRRVGRSWGFALEDLPPGIPIRAWHSADDENVPIDPWRSQTASTFGNQLGTGTYQPRRPGLKYSTGRKTESKQRA